MTEDTYNYYEVAFEPSKGDKTYAWHTAIGLQAVDGLHTSEYLIYIANQSIDGKITFSQAEDLISSYYSEKASRINEIERTEEADKVSARIALLLSERSFVFSPAELMSIHGRLFDGIYGFAGKLRDYNILKKEWVLNGESVIYGNCSDLGATLDYDISHEKDFNYRGLSNDHIVSHLAKFISGLWQVHPFGEGNTRCVAVFFIKYLRTLGFDVKNDLFEENSWYFRNALVRANYTNLQKDIHKTYEFIELFLRNLLLKENNALNNRDLRVGFD